MTEVKRLNTVLGILAVAILVGSFAAFAYTLVPKGDTSKVIVDDTEYAWGEIFGGYFFTETFDVEGKDFADSFVGVHLDDLIIDSGLSNPEGREYTVRSSDGYQATLNWTSISSGYLVHDGKGVVNDKITIFPGLPQRYWVYDVVEIGVE